jgi:hypothetical protein
MNMVYSAVKYGFGGEGAVNLVEKRRTDYNNAESSV